MSRQQQQQQQQLLLVLLQCKMVSMCVCSAQTRRVVAGLNYVLEMLLVILQDYDATSKL